VHDLLLQINGHERQSVRHCRYYSKFTPYTCCKSAPDSNDVLVYPFALEPFSYQPTGSLNFSRVDQATLRLSQAAMAVGAPHSNRRVYWGHSCQTSNNFLGNPPYEQAVRWVQSTENPLTSDVSKTDSNFNALKLLVDESDRARDVHVYALSYNVLRVQGGMGGVLFAN